MRALVYDRYGGPEVLRLEEVPGPAPGPGEVLVGVRAASVNSADVRLLRASPPMIRLTYGLRRPKHPILGADVAGTVEATGEEVHRLQVGDEVVGDLSGHGFGGFAELAVAPEEVLAMKPPTVPFPEAAAAPMALVTALLALHEAGGITPGDRVLVDGATGGVGTFTLQLALLHGGEVTATSSAGKMDHVRDLGAHEVLDYRAEDVTARPAAFDTILAVNGDHHLRAYRRALAPGGTYVRVGGTLRNLFGAMLLGPLLVRGEGRRASTLTAAPDRERLEEAMELLAGGDVTPVIDRSYPLEEAAEALRAVDEGRTRGKVVVDVGG